MLGNFVKLNELLSSTKILDIENLCKDNIISEADVHIPFSTTCINKLYPSTKSINCFGLLLQCFPRFNIEILDNEITIIRITRM